MQINSIHFLLTYACPYQCDHCFLYSSPSAKGSFTVGKIDEALRQISECPGITSVCFEGGEPFFYYPVLLYCVKKAKEMGLEVDIVTNCYWALDVDTAEFSLKPFRDMRIDQITLSEDEFHCGTSNPDMPPDEGTLPYYARKAAERLGIPEGTITIDTPVVIEPSKVEHTPGEPVVGGGVRFRGRAVETLVPDLPGQPPGVYRECPDEDFDNPGRLHLDSYGNIHACQGLIIGNINRVSLREFLADYSPLNHPIIRLLMEGGPCNLAEKAGIIEGPDDGEFVDACHLCFLARKGLMDKYPDLLGPPGVYGLDWAD